jgi:hypothetical protein
LGNFHARSLASGLDVRVLAEPWRDRVGGPPLLPVRRGLLRRRGGGPGCRRKNGRAVPVGWWTESNSRQACGLLSSGAAGKPGLDGRGLAFRPSTSPHFRDSSAEAGAHHDTFKLAIPAGIDYRLAVMKHLRVFVGH